MLRGEGRFEQGLASCDAVVGTGEGGGEETVVGGVVRLNGGHGEASAATRAR